MRCNACGLRESGEMSRCDGVNLEQTDSIPSVKGHTNDAELPDRSRRGTMRRGDAVCPTRYC